MIIRAAEWAARWLLEAWRGLTLDAKVVGTVAVANWLLLFANHTTVAATTDEPVWHLFDRAPEGRDRGVQSALRERGDRGLARDGALAIVGRRLVAEQHERGVDLRRGVQPVGEFRRRADEER